jgi:hypothetical protein
MNGYDDFPNLRLLAEMVLAEQDDLGAEYSCDQAHWDAVARVRRVPDDDQRLLVLSPINRARLRLAEHRLRQTFISEVANLNNAPRLLQAAARDARSSARFEPMDSFELRIIPSGPDGWAIELQVKNPERFPPGATLALLDAAGRVWVSDVPDDQGWVAALWEFGDDPNRYRGRLAICVDGVPVTK